jgi:histidyl-tRNA synthetase
MSKLSTDSYKGVRDFYPEEQFIQNYIFGVWKKTLESYGYEEYAASILEPADLYKQKSGEEIINEQTYTFKDRGDREVTLRPEMTPTIARMVAARRRELGFPLRWYSIPNLFRYEAPQRGRLREHWQLNADLFGVKTIEADIEMISMGARILKNFGAKNEDFEIRINTNSGDEKELKMVEEILGQTGHLNIKVDRTLERGQAYYTGVVFEFFDTNPSNSRSILGGGRYDNLLELFSNDNLPAVGFGMGDTTVRDFLETHNLLPVYRANTDLFMVLREWTERDVVFGFYGIVGELQASGVNVATYTSDKEPGDLYKTAEKLKIPYIAFVDAETISSGELTIKNMQTREEHMVSTKKLIDVQKIVK